MKKGDKYKVILIDRPVGGVVNMDVDGRPMAFRIVRKLASVACFPGGHGKSEYELVCIKTTPMTCNEISRSSREAEL